MALVYVIVVFCVGCGARKSAVEKQNVEIFEKREIQQKSPGDKIFISIPNKERPRGQQKVYSGRSGAESIVTFDRTGIVTHILCDCPEIDSKTNEVIDKDTDIKNKETDKKEAFGLKDFFWSFISGFLIGIIVWITKPWKSIFSWSRITDIFKK